MKIAIDLNDVVRDYSNNFVRYYVEGYNHDFNLDDLEIWNNDMSLVFPFSSKRSYENFVYNDFAYELFGKCDVCTRNLGQELNDWEDKDVKDIDTDEPISIMFVSSMEYGASIGYTYFFISKLGTKIREVYLPTDSLTIWDKCDVLITANPRLLENKPEGKKSIKISTDYNKDYEADYEYKRLSDFINDKNKLEELLK